MSTLTLEPTFGVEQIAQATRYSVSSVQKAMASRQLRSRREGRRKVSTQADIEAWLESLYDTEANRRAVRLTRADQKPRKQSTVGVQRAKVDADILEALNLVKP